MLFEKLSDYFVDDLIYKDTQLLFVLESPHNEEVKMGYPVAGKSGRDMSKVLYERGEPLGKLIFEQEVKNLGIINISNYPLQTSAYTNQELQEIEFFPKIRQNPKLRKHDKFGINGVLTTIMDDFQFRLEPHKDKKLILCGNFAQSAFDTRFEESEFKDVLRVPHPSFNQWLRASNRELIEKLKEFIR